MQRRTKLFYSVCLLAILQLCCTPKVNHTSQTSGYVNGQIKVMSYNIHHANPPSKTDLIDLDAVAAVIKKENPDLVGLQEVDQLTKRSGNVEEAKILAEKTGLKYQFFKAIDHDGGEYGVAILSRFPISNGTKIALPQVAKGEPRVLSYVEVTLPGRETITFANTHLDATRPDSNRVVQMKAILNELAKKKGPVIVVGDLNCEAKSQPIALLDQQYTRSCVTNCAATIPQVLPRKTIDYIAVKNLSWSLVEHRVIAELYASDHRPIVAVYQVGKR
jgi:endonuclease/exonuclease/phosphatase family metal-dependent hydrolase